MAYETLTTNEFFAIWKKYRPVLLKLMKDSLGGEPQHYKLYGHEFMDVNTKSTTTYSFKMEVFEGKVVSIKKASKMTEDLLAVLKQSPSARELMETNVFNFELDSSFNLTVSSVPKDQPEEEEEAEKVD